MRSGYLVEDPGPGPGHSGAYRSSCCFLKPLSERQSLILPLIQSVVNRAQTAWTEPGQKTLPAKAERSAKLVQLRDLEAEMAVVGVLEGPRWCGSKPKC